MTEVEIVCASTRQIVGREHGKISAPIGRIVRHLAGAGALRWIGKSRQWVAAAIHARGVISRIHNAKAVVLAQKGLLVLRADFEIIDTLHVGVVGMDAGVGKCAVLGDGGGLQVAGAQIGKGIRARVVAVAVSAEKRARLKTESLLMMWV